MNIKDVYKYLDAKYPKDFPILKPKIDEFYQQGIKPDRIYNLMSQYIDLKPYCRTLDVQNGDIIEFVKAVKIGTFLRAKFNNEETFSIMQKTLVFEDNNICIFKPTNFQESSVIGEPICCFAYSQGRWDEHYNGYQEAIYYVYDVMKEGRQHDFVSITVRPNGRALVLDKEHNWWSKQQSIQYIQSLEEGASYITTKDGKTIKTENKEYKTNTYMAKKQMIRLTEGDLHNIIKESVNRILKEEFQINLNNNGKEGFNNVNRWRAAAQEIQTKGSTIINIPLDYDNFLQANLMKTQRGGIYLETKDLKKEYASISDAFKALQDYAQSMVNY